MGYSRGLQSLQVNAPKMRHHNMLAFLIPANRRWVRLPPAPLRTARVTWLGRSGYVPSVSGDLAEADAARFTDVRLLGLEEGVRAPRCNRHGVEAAHGAAAAMNAPVEVDRSGRMAVASFHVAAAAPRASQPCEVGSSGPAVARSHGDFSR